MAMTFTTQDILARVADTLESRLPAQAYYHVQIRFERASGAGEEALRPLIEAHGFSIADLSYRFDGEERAVRHTMVLRTTNRASAARLSEALAASEGVLEFKITSTGD